MPAADDTTPRWSARVLTGAAQPRTLGEHKAFLLAQRLSPAMSSTLTNPDHAAEFERLYRKPAQSRNE